MATDPIKMDEPFTTEQPRYIFGRQPRRSGWILKEVEQKLAPHANKECRFAYGYVVAEFTEREDLLLFVAAKQLTDRTEEWT